MSTQNETLNTSVESNTLLSTKGVYHIYASRSEHASVVALKGITLEIKEGEFVSVVGPSGSGKSSLLRILGGLMRPTAGPVIFQGQDITKTVIAVRNANKKTVCPSGSSVVFITPNLKRLNQTLKVIMDSNTTAGTK